MVLITMSSLGYWDEIKETHPDKGSPYGGSGARRVRLRNRGGISFDPFCVAKDL